jgi:hypothetical protein
MLFYHLRHAIRLLGREPGFAAAALLTLALGVGANAAVFAVVEAVLLRPLPYADADRLVIVKHRDTRTGLTKEFIAIGDFVDLTARQSAFERIAGYGGGRRRSSASTSRFASTASPPRPDCSTCCARNRCSAGRSRQRTRVRTPHRSCCSATTSGSRASDRIRTSSAAACASGRASGRSSA